ncbi:MAG: hypothetical protein EA412_12195 [Chitinophagaceae bacterium]|nr:MAG: hypothetical protein EA412_12195 [Chitinophagaceae bacterium]
MKFKNIKYDIMYKVLTGLLINFLICCVTTISAQTIEETLKFGKEMYARGNYEAAIPAFERVIYFDDQEFSSKAFHLLADAYYETGDFRRAISYYDLAYYATEDEEDKLTFLLKKSFLLIVEGNYIRARMELFSIDEPGDPKFANQYNFFLALSYFQVLEFENSKDYFLKIQTSDSIFYKQEIENIFENNKRIDRLNPRTARIMSMIIPGSGQFYAGDIRGGLNSLLLTAGIVAIGYSTALTLSWVDASITYFPWFMRYYMGGYGNAAEAVRIRKDDLRSDLLLDLINLVEENQYPNVEEN